MEAVYPRIDMTERWKIGIRFLEEGDIYFRYLPENDLSRIINIDDIREFIIRLYPSEYDLSRNISINQKELPILQSNMNIAYGVIKEVDRQSTEGKFINKRNENKELQFAGKGTYAIVAHENKHTHLIYSLELPKRSGKIQKILKIKRKGNYIIAVKNRLSKFTPADPLELLNNKGSETMLIASGKDYERLGIMQI